jgi:hypothetical protein
MDIEKVRRPAQIVRSMLRQLRQGLTRIITEFSVEMKYGHQEGEMKDDMNMDIEKARPRTI